MLIRLGQISILLKILLQKNLFIPMVRTTNYGLKQLKANGPRIWNSLPTNIKNATTLITFTKSLKVHYSSQYG